MASRPSTNPRSSRPVHGRTGVIGHIAGAPQPGADGERLPVRLTDGRLALIPADLVQIRDGDCHVPLDQDDLGKWLATAAEHERPVADGDPRHVIPVVAESVQVNKREVETGRVSVRKRMVERKETIDEPLQQQHVEVERVSIERFVDEPPPIREEDGTTIVPVVEEVLVVEKRWMLREEVRIRQVYDTYRDPQTVVLRHEEVEIERHTTADSEPPAADRS